MNEHSGFCQCPGSHRHTAPSRERDCRVYLDAEDGYAPTIHCFHESCKDEVITTNFRLRSSIGKVAYRLNSHSGVVHRPNQLAIEQRPFETFLKACFEADDIISFAPSTLLDGETRTIPEHGGINVYNRDQWIKRAEEKGGIDKLYTTKHGLYIRINPVTPKSNGGDKDVTVFHR